MVEEVNIVTRGVYIGLFSYISKKISKTLEY
jgi:hypothetical protein